MKKTLLTAFGIAVIGGSLVFAGGSKETDSSKNGKIQLTVMHAYTKEEAVHDMTRKGPRETFLQFAQENANTIELNITEIQHNEYETKMQALAAANDLPDVFAMKGSWVSNFKDNGLIADISGAVNSCAWKSQYRDGLFLPVTFGNSIYGAPLQYSATTIVYYNKDLWEKAGYNTFPSTWEEIFAAIPKFQALGVNTIAFGNSSKWQFNSSWISALGPRVCGIDWVRNIIAMNGKAKFTDDSFIHLLDLVKQIGQSGALNPDYAVIGNQQASSAFLQDKAATTIDGYWNVEYMAGSTAPEALAKVDFAYLPTVKDSKDDQKTIASGCGWFVAVNSKLTGAKLAAAEKLAMYVSGPVLSQKMTDAGLVSTCNTIPGKGIKYDELHQKYHNFINKASGSTPIWDANINASVIATMNDQFVELLAGRTTSQAAAKAIQTEYESVMKK
jgi:raffinose/stachyose/melibiose transport system substrate-binding protein